MCRNWHWKMHMREVYFTQIRGSNTHVNPTYIKKHLCLAVVYFNQQTLGYPTILQSIQEEDKKIHFRFESHFWKSFNFSSCSKLSVFVIVNWCIFITLLSSIIFFKQIFKVDKIKGAMKMPSPKVANITDIISIGDNLINALCQTVFALRPTFEKLFLWI